MLPQHKQMNDNLNLPCIINKKFFLTFFFGLWSSFQWTQTRSVLFEFEFRQIMFLSSRNWLFLFEFKFEFATLIKPFISALLFEFNDFIFMIYCIFWTIKCMINTWPLLLLFSYRRCTIYMRCYLKRSKSCKTLNSSDLNNKEKKSIT